MWFWLKSVLLWCQWMFYNIGRGLFTVFDKLSTFMKSDIRIPISMGLAFGVLGVIGKLFEDEEEDASEDGDDEEEEDDGTGQNGKNKRRRRVKRKKNKGDGFDLSKTLVHLLDGDDPAWFDPLFSRKLRTVLEGAMDDFDDPSQGGALMVCLAALNYCQDARTKGSSLELDRTVKPDPIIRSRAVHVGRLLKDGPPGAKDSFVKKSFHLGKHSLAWQVELVMDYLTNSAIVLLTSTDECEWDLFEIAYTDNLVQLASTGIKTYATLAEMAKTVAEDEELRTKIQQCEAANYAFVGHSLMGSLACVLTHFIDSSEPWAFAKDNLSAYAFGALPYLGITTQASKVQDKIHEFVLDQDYAPRLTTHNVGAMKTYFFELKKAIDPSLLLTSLGKAQLPPMHYNTIDKVLREIPGVVFPNPSEQTLPAGSTTLGPKVNFLSPQGGKHHYDPTSPRTYAWFIIQKAQMNRLPVLAGFDLLNHHELESYIAALAAVQW